MNNGLSSEWKNAKLGLVNDDHPVLPLPRALLSLMDAPGSRLVSLSFSDIESGDTYPFETVINVRNVFHARRMCDRIIAWGRVGLIHCFLDLFLPLSKKKTLFLCYDWPTKSNDRSSLVVMRQFFVRRLALLSKKIIVMTSAQFQDADNASLRRDHVEKISIKLDKRFYLNTSVENIKNNEINRINSLLRNRKYAVMLGDELRLTNDSLKVCKNSGVVFIRIFQYKTKYKISKIREEIKKYGLEDQYFIFHNINHLTLLKILKGASAYAGLVDSTWQPAGWTATLEALSCGVHAILYEGLVSEELRSLGVPSGSMSSVQMGDISHFSHLIRNSIAHTRSKEEKLALKKFMENNLLFATSPAVSA